MSRRWAAWFLALLVGAGIGSATPGRAQAPRVPSEESPAVEVQRIDRRIAALRVDREAVRLAGPRGLAITGGLVTYAGTVPLLLNLMDPGTFDQNGRPAIIGCGALVVTGIAMLAGGAAWIGRRKRERHAIDHEIDRLRRDRERMVRRMIFSTWRSPDRTATYLALGWTF